MNESPMRGIWPILFAFFDSRGRLDRDAMRRQVHAALGWGAPGVAVLGVATEVGKLSVDERRDVIRWAAEDLAGRAPLAVTIAGETVDAQRSLADYAVSQGAAQLILQPPPAAAATLRGDLPGPLVHPGRAGPVRHAPRPVRPAPTATARTGS